MFLRTAAFFLSSSLIAAQFQGSIMAPVKIEVFSDFSCPHCRDLNQETIKPMIGEFVTPGKIYLVHRDFLLGKFPYSREAALYANAAARLKKFELVSDTLFDKQPVWTKDGNIDKVVAAVLSKDEMIKVRLWIKDPAIVDGITAGMKADMAEGQSIQLTSTPTMLITTRKQQPMKINGGTSLPLLRSYLAGVL